MLLTENARKILKQRYLLLNETPEERFHKVAKLAASAEPTLGEQRTWEEVFYNSLLEPLNFMPNSPTIANAHLNNAGLSACFVMSPEDNLNSIYQVLWDSSLVISSGGGMGYGLSKVREKEAPVNNVQKVAGGPIWLLEMLSQNSRGISQGFRPGANMAQMEIDHPDIREFIHAKDNITALTNFNISVQVPDAFMRQVDRGGRWYLYSRYNGEVTDSLPARELWEELVTSAHRTGDPGIVFIDRIHESAPNPHLGPIQTSNPCGEEFLEDYGSCCLGSINVGNFVRDSNGPDGPTFEWSKFKQVVGHAVRFLDNIITVNCYNVAEVKRQALSTRRIGLGIMGLADALVMLGLDYTSQEAQDFAAVLCSTLTDTAYRKSQELAEIKGPYLSWQPGRWSDIPIRNSSVTTIAPTGTISRIAGCSSGIEPYYSLAWRSKIMWDNNGPSLEILDCPRPMREWFTCDGEFDMLHEFIASVLEASTEAEQRAIISRNCPYSPDLLRTAKEIPWQAHLEMLSRCQANITNSISKTINLPSMATVFDVAQVYWRAFEKGCKAVTIYRDGSRDNQVLDDSKEKCNTCGGSIIYHSGCKECEVCGVGRCEI